MGRDRYVVDAVVLEGCSRREAARRAGVSKGWVDKLVARYKEGGYDALAPRSRRPKGCSHAAPAEVQDAVLAMRDELMGAGHDAGPHTIRHHLALTRSDVPSVSTIWRILKRNGRITPEPHKRPRSSFVRFEAALPNEMWQGDFTHWLLADGSGVEILDFIDDHSRFLTALSAFPTVKAIDVVETFYTATDSYGLPAAVLTDNGAVFTGKSRKGRVLFETELERQGITYKNSRPYHPQTCGKIERFHQTLKRYLAKQPPAASLPHLQIQLDTFREYYNHRRPHRALQGATPLAAFNARMKAHPEQPAPETHFRVRHDKVDKTGCLTLRYLSKLRHIRVGHAFRGQTVSMLIADAHVRVLAEDGSLIRELTLDPDRDYQPLGTPSGRRQSGYHLPRQVATMS